MTSKRSVKTNPIFEIVNKDTIMSPIFKADTLSEIFINLAITVEGPFIQGFQQCNKNSAKNDDIWFEYPTNLTEVFYTVGNLE